MATPMSAARGAEQDGPGGDLDMKQPTDAAAMLNHLLIANDQFMMAGFGQVFMNAPPTSETRKQFVADLKAARKVKADLLVDVNNKLYVKQAEQLVHYDWVLEKTRGMLAHANSAEGCEAESACRAEEDATEEKDGCVCPVTPVQPNKTDDALAILRFHIDTVNMRQLLWERHIHTHARVKGGPAINSVVDEATTHALDVDLMPPRPTEGAGAGSQYARGNHGGKNRK